MYTAIKYEVEFTSFRASLYSANLKRKVRFRWMAPPEYRETSVGLPVVLMNDGQDYMALNLERTLTACYASRLLQPFVFVAIETNVHRIQEYGTASSADYKGRGKRAGAYSRFITEEFVPFLKSAFNLSPEKEDWVFCGMSLGGLSAMDIVVNHPELFGKVGVFSGSFWWRSAAYVKADKDDRSRIILDVIRDSPRAPHLKFWLQCGTLDETADRNKNGVIDAIDDTLDVISELENKGYRRQADIEYLLVEGGRHDLPTWAEAYPEFLRWAFQKQA